jgi:AraC-like DNA-binding protein
LPGIVHQILGYRETAGFRLRRRQVPQFGVVVIISLGQPLRVARVLPETGAWTTYTSFAAGVHDVPVLTEHDGTQEAIELVLNPTGAYALLGLPMHTLANRIVDLADVFGGPALDTLINRLNEASDWAARFDHVTAALLTRLADGSTIDPTVVRASQRLRAAHGNVPVQSLARELGLSRRRLTARFQEHIGLPPKVVGRILRFSTAIAAVSDPTTSFADLATRCGYYDQAHLNRDFRALSGLTPTAFRAARFPDGTPGISDRAGASSQ